MNVCVFGLGAVGGLFAHRLACAGFSVSGIARANTLRAVREHGISVISNENLSSARISVTDAPHDLGPQDLVIIAVKCQSLPEVADMIAPLLGANTLVLPVMNGVPWWFSDLPTLPQSEGATDWLELSVRIGSAIPPTSIIGAVVYPNCEVICPGLVQHNFGNNLVIGEPNGSMTRRVARVKELLQVSGFDVSIAPNVRVAIWEKLMGNAVFNPVSALTHASSKQILDDGLCNSFCRSIVTEVREVGIALGLPLNLTVDSLIESTRSLGHFPTSMYQDAVRSRPLEVEGIIGAIHALAERFGIRTPFLGVLLGMVRVRSAFNSHGHAELKDSI